VLTVEQVYENYGKNENKLAVFAVSQSSTLASLYSAAAQKYGTSNPPKAPYIVNTDGGGKVITASGGNSYKPFMKVITPTGQVTNIDWYATPQGYGYEKIRDILKGFGINPGGTTIQGAHAPQQVNRSIVIQTVTHQYCRFFCEENGGMLLKAYSLKGEFLFQKNVTLLKGITVVFWNTTLASGGYLLIMQIADRKIPQWILITE